MPLDIPQAPPDSISSLNLALLKVASHVNISRHAPAIARSANKAMERGPNEPATPLLSSAVYVLGLDAIAEGGGLSAARLSLWTHFLPATDGNDQVVAADVDAQTNRFAALTEGSHVLEFYRHVASLKEAPEIQSSAFGLAQLRVPALHVNAVWLKDKRGSGDIVIPMRPTDPALIPGRQYSANEFIDALRPAARRALAETDPLKGG